MIKFYMEQSSMNWMIIAAVLGVLLPIVTYVVWWKKKQASVLPVLATAMLSYLMTASLKNFFTVLIFKGLGYTADMTLTNKEQAIAATVDAVLTAVLMFASVLLVLKYFLKNYKTKEIAISTGIGIGLMNCFKSAFNNFTMYVTVSTVSEKGVEATYDLEQMEQPDIDRLLQTLEEIMKTPTSRFVLSTVAMVMLFALEVCVGALLFFAFFEKNTVNYLIAIVARIGFDLSIGIIPKQWLCLAVLVVLDVAIAFYVIMTYRKSEILEIDPEQIQKQKKQSLFITEKNKSAGKSISAVMNQSSVLNNSEEKSE